LELSVFLFTGISQCEISGSFTATSMKMAVFWDVPCSLVDITEELTASIITPIIIPEDSHLLDTCQLHTLCIVEG
jgi:hypothetical protein